MEVSKMRVRGRVEGPVTKLRELSVSGDETQVS